MPIVRLDHVQIAIPPDGEAQARAFYSVLLGIPERAKPASLAARGGVWFESGELKLHAGVDADFHPATKAHPALQVDGLGELIERLRGAGVRLASDEPLEGYDRIFAYDPFGNRIELLQPTA
jgi:catechol 2,3-dioxygenase-like lactoylglutathione lyase family enzyme